MGTTRTKALGKVEPNGDEKLGSKYLPVALRHVIERRVHAVNVVRDVALVAQQETRLVVALTASFAHGAVQTPPALLQDHFRHLHDNQRKRH